MKKIANNKKAKKIVLTLLTTMVLGVTAGTLVGMHDATKSTETSSRLISGITVSNNEVYDSIWYNVVSHYYGRNDHEVLGYIESHPGEEKTVFYTADGIAYVNVEGIYVGMLYDLSAQKNFYCFDTIENGNVRRRYVEDTEIDSSVCEYDIDTKCLISIKYGTNDIIAVAQETF